VTDHIDHSLVTDWLIALLEGMEGGFAVGDHAAPPGADPREDPYLVVWEIPGGSVEGPALTAPEADHSIVYQVDAVGFTRKQAQRLAARAGRAVAGRDAVTGAYLVAASSPAGLSVHDRISEGAFGGVTVEGTAPDEVYTVPNRYVLTVTPA